MMRANITVEYIANCGLLLCSAEHRVLVDAFHKDRCFPFSPVPHKILQRILLGQGEFADPDIILVTHFHKDHADQELLAAYSNQSVPIMMPMPVGGEVGLKLRNPIISKEATCQEVMWSDGKGLRITAIPTLHDGGRGPASTKHNCFLLGMDGFSVLLLGDAYLKDPKLAKRLAGVHPNLVCVNFIEMLQDSGRTFLKEVICPEHILFCHLPLPKDDVYGYHRMLERSILQFHADMPDMRYCFESGQQFTFETEHPREDLG